MATPKQPSARFRSATEFPRDVGQLSSVEVVQLYAEMRECLIFTNRSRSQLLRRNDEHKTTAQSLRADLLRLQSAVSQLNLEKQQLARQDREIIDTLKQEIGTMSSHLDKLSFAFEDVEEINSVMGIMAIPGRFAKFWQALKALIIWWRDEQGYEPRSQVSLPPRDSDSDRQENPQMHTDPASVQRSLRD
jgi:hypothetical protein